MNYQTKEVSSPLFLAAEGRHLETVKVLVEAGADLNLHNVKGYRPLRFARLQQYEGIRDFLVARGALE